MYKMKGFTYPGKSPVKLFGIGARKKAEKEAAYAAKAEASEKWRAAMDTKSDGTSIVAGNNPKYGEVPTMKKGPILQTPTSLPIQPAQPLPVSTPGPVMPSKQAVPTGGMSDSNATLGHKLSEAWDSQKANIIGQATGAVVKGAIGALTRKKEKPKRATGTARGFSSVKIGRS